MAVCRVRFEGPKDEGEVMASTDNQKAPTVPPLAAGGSRRSQTGAALRVAAAFVLLLLVGPLPFARPALGATCEDVAARGLNVLTINLLFPEIAIREDRLRQIAAFAAQNKVDVILLQEVVAGLAANTENSAEDLRDILSLEQGLDYEIAMALEAGSPASFAVANATLSRCAILRPRIEQLPPASEVTIAGAFVPTARNLLMTLLDLPGFGRVSVYNTHLCAGCAVERAAQVEAILGAIAKI